MEACSFMIEIVKPELTVGSERRLANFIRDLSEKDKIAIISHTDVDGIVAAKVANRVLGGDFIRFIDHSELNDNFIKWIKEKKINKIFMTDISFPDRKYLRKVEKLAKAVIVDHHTFKEDLNTGKSVFISTNGYCASYLCYYLFSKMQNIENMDWLVACASLFDWLFQKNQDWMKGVFEKHNEKFSLVDKELKETKFWKLQYEISLAALYFKDDLVKIFDSLGQGFGDIGDLEKYAKEVDTEIVKAISDFYINKEDIKDGYYMEFNSKFPVKTLVVNILSAGTPNKMFIVAQENGEYENISARRIDGKVNLPELLRKLIAGFEDSNAGGHVVAAGVTFPLKYKEEFKKRLMEM